MKSQSKAKLSAQAPSTLPEENAEAAKGEAEGPTSGYDRFQFISGAVYTGNWRLVGGKKLKHGFGKLQFGGTTGAGEFGSEEYEGEWQDDLMHGYLYTSGAEYTGQWNKGKQQGRGEYVWPDGSRYSGEWDGHLMNGEGFFIDRDGIEWPGIFVKGCYETKDQKQLRAQREVR